ncbi:MAG: DegT/DnrJ/EryC1/StrS family aminotransferase [Thermoplasmatota archaeon]
MISVRDEKLYRDLSALRNHGRYEDERDVSTVAGFNMRMPEINAAVGCVQLRHMPEWIERRREVARIYDEELQGVGDLVLPVERSWGKHVYYLYVVRSSQRDGLQKFLRDRGIASGVHYRVPAHRMPYIEKAPDLPVTDRIVDEILSLPMHPLLSGEEQEEIIGAVREFYGG